MKEQLIEKLERLKVKLKQDWRWGNAYKILDEAIQALTSVKSEPMNYESQKAIQDNLVESYPFKKSESAEEVLLLQKALNEYINLRHTQQECTGFIDGYEKGMHDFANNSEAMKWIRVEDRLPENDDEVPIYHYQHYLTNKEN